MILNKNNNQVVFLELLVAAKKGLNWILTCAEISNHPIYVDISPTIVNNSWMERFSQVATTAWEPKNLIFLKKTCLP